MTAEPDLVSAVIPAYNYARFVAGAITSVLEQTYPALECIVVDDGSTDETRAVLETFGDRIRVVYQENRGLSAARNTGIAAARGRYIAFLDADDRWRPGKVERQVRWLQSHPDVGCLGCGREHVESDGSRVTFPGQANTRSREDTLRAIAVRKFWVGGSGSGALVRADVLSRVGNFDESLSAAEDWDMWLRFAAATGIDNVPDVLTSISRHGTGVFRNVDRMERNAWTVYEKAVKEWPAILGPSDRRQIRALILADAAGESLASGQRRRSLSYLWRALREWPFHARRWRTTAAVAVRLAMGGGR
jgi:glycosyltransferase involved in cell wall biosynthesis